MIDEQLFGGAVRFIWDLFGSDRAKAIAHLHGISLAAVSSLWNMYAKRISDLETNTSRCFWCDTQME